MRFADDFYWQIASLGTQKWLFTATHALSFMYAYVGMIFLCNDFGHTVSMSGT